MVHLTTLNGYSMDILSQINWIDILILIVMLRTSYLAFQHGLSHEIFPLFGSILMVSLALRYYLTLSGIASKYVIKLPQDILNLLSFASILFVSGVFFRIIGALFDNIMKVTWHPLIEKFGGLLIGVIKASVVTSMVLIVLALVPLSYLQHSVRDRSLMGMRFLEIGPNIYEQVSRFLPAVKLEKSVVHKDELMHRLSADKSVQPGGKPGKGLAIP
ncbi:MAG: CvpA family protein [Candidatus Omnitrophica bacterium]|nr:CvpA family protein [Candidatus Omnitrophota bacterium]